MFLFVSEALILSYQALELFLFPYFSAIHLKTYFFYLRCLRELLEG